MQVKNILVERINSGSWAPGQALPSEMSLAAELGVSQGTVRKALNALADISIIERRQGKGTYVVEHTSSQVLFKFFQIHDASGNRIKPGTEKSKLKQIPANKDIANSLNINRGDPVIEVTRLRTHKEKPIIEEVILLPKALFAGLSNRDDLPNTLYDFYQKEYGITVYSVKESLSAIPANKRQSKDLKIAEKSPLLMIDRIAYDIEEVPVERRFSYCITENLNYVSMLR